MALYYLEIRWILTEDKNHLKILKEYNTKISNMNFDQLTSMSPGAV